MLTSGSHFSHWTGVCLVCGIFPSFVYTGLLVRVFPHLHRLNVTHYSKSSPLHAVCSLFICMTDPSQICPSPILLELLELFQDVNCNNERLKGGTLKPLITELLLHGKPFFFFFWTSWKDGLSKNIALEYDLSCIIGKDDISFFRKFDLTR